MANIIFSLKISSPTYIPKPYYGGGVFVFVFFGESPEFIKSSILFQRYFASKVLPFGKLTTLSNPTPF